MYVTAGPTIKEIEREIRRIEAELEGRMSDRDRQALHDELDYLESFLPVEIG